MVNIFQKISGIWNQIKEKLNSIIKFMANICLTQSNVKNLQWGGSGNIEDNNKLCTIKYACDNLGAKRKSGYSVSDGYPDNRIVTGNSISDPIEIQESIGYHLEIFYVTQTGERSLNGTNINKYESGVVFPIVVYKIDSNGNNCGTITDYTYSIDDNFDLTDAKFLRKNYVGGSTKGANNDITMTVQDGTGLIGEAKFGNTGTYDDGAADLYFGIVQNDHPVQNNQAPIHIKAKFVFSENSYDSFDYNFDLSGNIKYKQTNGNYYDGPFEWHNIRFKLGEARNESSYMNIYKYRTISASDQSSGNVPKYKNIVIDFDESVQFTTTQPDNGWKYKIKITVHNMTEPIDNY